LLAHADTHAGSALFLHINRMTDGGPLHSALWAVAAAQKRQHACVSIEERAFLQSGLAPQAYYEATVRGKKRKELRRQKTRLSELGALGFAREEGGEGLDEWIAQFLRLEAAGWKGQNRSAIGSHQESRDFFIHVLRAAAAAGGLERLTLRFDDRPIAMLVNFLCPPGSFSFKTAFDEAFARFSPGVLLQIENLGILDRAGIDWMDSCAAEDHPMIDSLWSDRRRIGRYSIAIGGTARRTAFRAYRLAEDWRARRRERAATVAVQEENAE
jgi:CelD/BcsL family acetyltransferase involved in cellulose biosynthesis